MIEQKKITVDSILFAKAIVAACTEQDATEEEKYLASLNPDDYK